MRIEAVLKRGKEREGWKYFIDLLRNHALNAAHCLTVFVGVVCLKRTLNDPPFYKPKVVAISTNDNIFNAISSQFLILNFSYHKLAAFRWAHIVLQLLFLCVIFLCMSAYEALTATDATWKAYSQVQLTNIFASICICG